MPTIQTLIKRFTNQLDTYKNPHYNETQTRLDFINPFFEALGWDINNKQGLAETYRHVVHEDALKIGRATKMPDYSFRIGGVRKFFVEAKKPAINLFKNPEPAYQVRRYGWNAKLSLSILTNFAEFIVYDCRIKPAQTDSPSTARLFYIKYTDYLARWDELVALFSFKAVWHGEFDKYAATQLKKANIEVDTAFLTEIERWREMLARQIALDNPKLTQRQLNRSVQQTIDRIIFLRICEDRGIEDYGRLLTLLNGTQIYKRLFQFFRQADERYNSGLFHFKAEKARDEPDNLTPTLRITDKILKDIIKNLYYPNSPYEFSVLPADILGQVYERFLGKVIYLSSDRKAKIEEKPEVKKAGGVFYTPSYIVDYIVEKTVMPLLKGKKAGPRGGASRLKILDPACGSGSFLLGAYQRLLDWHLEQYLLAPEKWVKGKKPRIYQSSGGSWKLTVDERKRILLNNIYGVDIDQQAVEVTKLSLLLKVLEDEQSVISQFSLFEKRVLPDLDNNIKCGNSLIGNDFYDAGQQLGLLDEELLYRINAFDWVSEFKMGSGGFDAVIGNPPYVRQELLGDSKSYFKEHYRVFHGVADLYVYFIEKGVSLLRENGRFGIIVANKWMRANYGKPLRQWLKLQHLSEIIDFGDLPVFQQATTYPCILGIEKMSPQANFDVAQVKSLDFADLKSYVAEKRYSVQQASLEDSGWALVDEKTRRLLDKLLQVGVPLGEYVNGKIYYGIKTGLNEAFVIDAETREGLIAADAKSEVLIKRFLLGRDIKRYQPLSSERYLILMPKGWTRLNSNGAKDAFLWLENHYPSIAAHLAQFSKKAQKRCDKGEYWWELRACGYYGEFEKPKIIYMEIALTGQFTLDENHFYGDTTTYILGSDSKYLLGILNSKLWTFLFSNISSKIRGGFHRWKRQYMSPLPIRTIDFNNPTDKANHDKIVQLVEQILALNKQLAAATEPQMKKILKRRISAIDGEIDQLVYGLYGLTGEEIGIIEESV